MNNKNSSSGIIKIVLGAIGAGVFGILFVVSTIGGLFLHGLSAGAVSGALIAPVVVFGAGIVGSLGLLFSGTNRRKLIERLSKYNALIDTSNIISFDDITANTGIPKTRILKDLRLADKTALHFPLYTDNYQTTVIRGDYAYNQYLETEKQRLLKEREDAESARRLNDPSTSSIEAFRIESNNTINKIRAANLILPGEKISESLKELETTVVRIFRHIERHPEKLSETRKLMNYHIPTTLKLVEKYCQYDTMEYQPQNVKEAKTEIEDALDTVNVAFTNFLEDLFHMETLDVSTDIDVLHQMLERDGLKGSKFDINDYEGEQNE